MKKSVAVLTALITVLSITMLLPLSAFASAHVPQGSLSETKTTDADTVFVFSVGADSYVLNMEKERSETFAKLIANGKTAADLDESMRFIAYPLEITVKCTTEFGTTGLAKSIAVGSNKIEVSLINDIMPSLVGKHGSFDERLLDGFSFTLSLCYTNYNGTVHTELSDENFGESTAMLEFSVPNMYFIEYVLPSDAKNADGNVSFGFAPLTDDIRIGMPTRVGYTFTGWTDDDGEYVGTVPAGTKHTVLTSNWEDKTYGIKYVLTTANGYNFKSVNNTANPTSYAHSEGASLVSPTVPKGWRFMGWTDSDGNTVTEIRKGSVGDIVLYACWLSEDDYIDKVISDAHWCDVDSDGEVTVRDARLVLRAAVELEELPAGTLKRVDFAGQGKADVSQARFVLRIAVGLETVRGVLEYYEYEF